MHHLCKGQLINYNKINMSFRDILFCGKIQCPRFVVDLHLALSALCTMHFCTICTMHYPLCSVQCALGQYALCTIYSALSALCTM